MAQEYNKGTYPIVNIMRKISHKYCKSEIPFTGIILIPLEIFSECFRINI